MNNSKYATKGTPKRGVHNLRYPRQRYKSTTWRKGAWGHVAKLAKQRTKNNTFLGNLRSNLKKGNQYKGGASLLGWGAKTVDPKHATALRAQRKWRYQYHQKYDRIPGLDGAHGVDWKKR